MEKEQSLHKARINNQNSLVLEQVDNSSWNREHERRIRGIIPKKLEENIEKVLTSSERKKMKKTSKKQEVPKEDEGGL